MRVAIIVASSVVLYLDLPLYFFLGLMAWLDFGFRDVAGFGELDSGVPWLVLGFA